jgi:quaternary ammonium compound-resistance protein SugE
MRIWMLLLTAGVLEVCWAVGIKYTDGFSRPGPSVLTLATMIGSVALLGYCVRWLPLGTAYAIWTGIGVLGTVVFGIVALGESTSWVRIVCLLMILTGVFGLQMSHR